MISGTAAAPARLRVTRRGIQIVLGLLWLLDGLLQFQRAMLTPKFAVEVIAPAGAGEPGFIAGPVGELVRIILHQPVMMDVAFGLIQLALGAGILYARTARRALAASVAWAVLVWYLGERARRAGRRLVQPAHRGARSRPAVRRARSGGLAAA